MKIFIKFCLFSLGSILLLGGCQKTMESKMITEEVFVKNGVVTFLNRSAYDRNAENQKNEQGVLFARLEQELFKNLETKSTKSKSNATYLAKSLGESENVTFDRSLYTDYMLKILNEDKICRINGFLVKVNMEKVFCSFIDEKEASDPAKAYENLRDDNFSNADIHVFLNPDEPVLEVLTQMREKKSLGMDIKMNWRKK